MIGTTEFLVIIVVILILFGSSAIPKFARSLGKAKAEFEKGIKEGKEGMEESRKRKSKK